MMATNLATNLTSMDQPWQTSFPNLLNLPHIEKTFWRGMPVYSLEEPASHVYVVLKGRVKILRTSADGQQKILSIRYRGEFIDGTVFDSSDAAGGPVTFELQHLIPGWVEVIPLMKEGDVWQVVVPYQLGYGAEGRGPIPPRQTLVFQIELLKVTAAPPP